VLSPWRAKSAGHDRAAPARRHGALQRQTSDAVVGMWSRPSTNTMGFRPGHGPTGSRPLASLFGVGHRTWPLAAPRHNRSASSPLPCSTAGRSAQHSANSGTSSGGAGRGRRGGKQVRRNRDRKVYEESLEMRHSRVLRTRRSQSWPLPGPPQSLGMERMKKTAPTEAVGCKIDNDQRPKMIIQAKWKSWSK
jgi:hypothetical protein